MSNSFYNHGSAPATGATLSSSTIRAEFDSVATGFDKLPTLTGNGSEVVRVNSGGTALETIINTELQASDVHALSSKATPVDADEFALIDSAASYALAKLTWANLKATIKTYYDSLTTTLTNKTIALGSNTVSGTTAQFNTALSDGDFATLAGTETLTNKALNGSLGATTPSTVAATHIDVNGTSSSTSTAITATTGASYNLTQNSGSSLYVGCDNSAGSAMTGTAYATAVWGVGAVPLIFGTNNTEKMRIDPSGNVGIGVPPSAWVSTAKAIEMGGGALVNQGNTNLGISQNLYLNTSSQWIYKASLGATLYNTTGSVHNWYNAPTGTAGNVATLTQAMTLDASGGLKTLNTIGVGNATPSTSGAGITFPATQSASTDANTLDDYEEGTWTPSFGGSGGKSGQTYSLQSGVYTKVGNLVYAGFRIILTAKGTLTGTLQIEGLPFTIKAGQPFSALNLASWAALATNWVEICGAGNAGTTTVGLQGNIAAAAGNNTSLVSADFNNTTTMIGAITYLID